MNCANILRELANSISTEHADIQEQCLDYWGDNYGSVVVYLVEEEYRDYDELWQDIFDKLKSLTPGVPWCEAMAKDKPDTEYRIEYSKKNSGLCVELFLYNVAWLKAQP